MVHSAVHMRTTVLLLSAACGFADEITWYELLAPDSHQFAIVYDVSQPREGARYFFNPIRRGAVATGERVIERATGKELKFTVVNGKAARESGEGPRSAPDDQDYIRVELPRPVPKNAETRIRIYKTYEDAKSYYLKDGMLVFDRPLGIKRNVVILPKGWEVIGSASPAIVSMDPEGRVRLSFQNDRDDQLPVRITARRLP